MTANKPEVVAWYFPSSKTTLPVVSLNAGNGNGQPLIHLSDYEALQAKYEKLLKHLQSLIDQTTPLVPIPGDPMWMRRIQLDEVIAERDQLRAECEKLRKDAERYRWWRDEARNVLYGDEVIDMMGDPDAMDCAIDAAMQQDGEA